MKLKRIIPIFIIIAVLILFIPNACNLHETDPTAGSQPSQTATLSIAQSDRAYTATPKPDEDSQEDPPTSLLGELITDRTPQPTATPGPAMQAIEAYAARWGFLYTRFLGIRLVDWIDILLSALIVLVGYLLGTWLIKRVLPRIVKRTATELDDAILEKVGRELRWLITVIILRFALTERLTFIGERFSQILSDIFFTLTLSLFVWILWKIIEIAADSYANKQAIAGRENVKPVIEMVSKIIQILTGIVGGSILLSYFGVNVTTLTAALGIGGLAISLAAQNTVADAIAGFIILIDQPFRVGDRIEIQGVGTWGDVTEIGLRTTRIRTRDNRMVIVPNSILSHNQIVNYSYPDPRYRIQTHVYIPFGENVEQIRQLLIDAVKQVDGVLTDKPVDALFIDMTEGPIKFRLRWWIESYADTRRMFDRVHTTIKNALDEAGIQSPKTSDEIYLKIDPLTIEKITKAFQSQPLENRKNISNTGNEDPNQDVRPRTDDR
ncbi:MAG: mechanosensitive ion channel family protein [Anaerolineales bacterium]